MIEFMVISGERSGSTWAANWLTTDTTLCLHDPLLRYDRFDLDKIEVPGKRIGISCTALRLFPEWLDAHHAPKLILHRPAWEIRQSYDALGVESVLEDEDRLFELDGTHMSYQNLFDPFYAHSAAVELDVPWDAARHAELVQMNIQPRWAKVHFSANPTSALIDRIRSELEKTKMPEVRQYHDQEHNDERQGSLAM